MWKVVVFPDNEVAAVPISWLITMNGKLMCFWPEKNARTKRAKNENPTSGDDKYKLHECRVLMNDETYENFKKALAKEILAQDVSFVDAETDDAETDDVIPSCNKKLKRSEDTEKFEFIKPEKVNVIDSVKIIEKSPPGNSLPASILNKGGESQSPNKANDIDVGLWSRLTEFGDPDQVLEPLVTPIDKIASNDLISVDEVKDFESSSISEKLKIIFTNQMAEKKVYTELSNRMASVEKHIKKYGGGAYSKTFEKLTLQVASATMFSQLEKELDDATTTALADNFNKTIYEKDIKQYVKVLLLRFFDGEFYAHNVTCKSGGNVILNKSRTLSCIYESIEKKFDKENRDVEDTVSKAIDQLKDSLRKKYPKSKKQKSQAELVIILENKDTPNADAEEEAPKKE